MRRLFGLFGAGIGGALLGALLMVASRSHDAGPEGATSGPAPTATTPAKVAPLPRARADVLLAWAPKKIDPALTKTARGMPEVDAVSEVAGGLTDLVASHDGDGAVVDRPEVGWSIPLDTVAIDPADHAKFASVADRATVAGLADGQALLGRTSAKLRRLDVGATIKLDRGPPLMVAGIVEDAAIGAAEMAVTRATGQRLGVTTPRYLLIAHHGDRAAVETALRRAMLVGAPLRFRGQGEAPYLRQGDAVLPDVKLKERFGEFAYKRPGAGARDFVQDPGWQSANLVTRDMPLLGRMTCHRGVVDAIHGALADIEAGHLGHLVDPKQFAGCWTPRLVTAGGDGDLSHHAWGVALDINYDANPTGQESTQDQRVVAIFERWGFTWGGEWLLPDPSHFEYLQPPRGPGLPWPGG